MHFRTLVTVEIPKVTEDTTENLVVKMQLGIIKKLAEKKPGDIMLKISRRTLECVQTSFARRVYNDVYSKLERYCEATDNPDYLEFEDRTDELREEYENGSVDAFKLPGGMIVSQFNNLVCGKFVIHDDGKVYQTKFGQLKHDKRSKRAKKMTGIRNCPYKKIYKTFEAYAEQEEGYVYNSHFGGYGFTYNPDAFYDWCLIGGRWPNMFLVKEECTEYSLGERSWYNDGYVYEAPTGYRWVAAARKKDIEWQTMRDWALEKAKEMFYELEEVYRTKDFSKYHCNIVGNKLVEFGNILYIEGESLDVYLHRKGYYSKVKYPVNVYGFLDDEGYNEENDWWPYKGSRKKLNKIRRRQKRNWMYKVDRFIDDLCDETVIVGVDCHI